MRQSGLRILLVDDARTIEVTNRILELEGHSVLRVCNGAAVIEETVARQPDIVLLGLRMTEMEAVDLCSRIKKESGVPVVVLTTDPVEHDATGGSKVDADGFVVRPFNALELVSVINTVLRRAVPSWEDD